MAVSWPDHLLSLDEWALLPPDSTRRFELVEGVLLVTPRPALLHQRAMIRLATTLDAQLPPDLCAIGDVEVVVDAGAERGGAPATVRVPDVVVVRSALAAENPSRVDASDVVLAVEIISPGTRTTDRVTKAFQYAGAGIPGYWLVDIDEPATMTAYVLVDGDYEIVADGRGVLDLVTPVTARVDLSVLTAR
jgi:Uma2 family endonuclease